MGCLGNLLWLLFGGLATAFEYFTAGLVLCLTVVGIPWGLQAFKLGVLALFRVSRGGSPRKWRLSRHLDECHLVFHRWFLHLPHPCLLWVPALHHHCRHPLGADEFPLGPPRPLAFRQACGVSFSPCGLSPILLGAYLSIWFETPGVCQNLSFVICKWALNAVSLHEQGKRTHASLFSAKLPKSLFYPGVECRSAKISR